MADPLLEVLQLARALRAAVGDTGSERIRGLLNTAAYHLEELWGEVQHLETETACPRCTKRDAAGARPLGGMITLQAIDTIRETSEFFRNGGQDPELADALEQAADRFETVADNVGDIEFEHAKLAARLQELERLLEGLATICDRARLACNLTEGDAVPVLEAR